jgi:AcrR family transcriptional regulator
MSTGGRRATPRQLRSEQTVDSLLDAASQVFAARGVDAATTTMIAKEAGVSVGTLYRFYDDKTAVAAALTDRYAFGMFDVVTQVEALIAEQPPTIVPDAIALVVHGVAELTKKNPEYFVVMRHLRDNRLQEVQVETLAQWFETLAPGTLPLAGRRQVAAFVSEATRALVERAPAKGKARQDHLDEIIALLAPYVEQKLRS